MVGVGSLEEAAAPKVGLEGRVGVRRWQGRKGTAGRGKREQGSGLALGGKVPGVGQGQRVPHTPAAPGVVGTSPWDKLEDLLISWEAATAFMALRGRV